MIAGGRIPVGHPVDADGMATDSWAAMVGCAGRGGADRVWWDAGEDFPLITDRGCLTVLLAPMDVTVGGIEHRLAARENHYVHLARGKIIDFQGRASTR